MNISESFANYLEGILGVTLGTNLFIGEAPSSNKVADSIWWIVASGGQKTTSLMTGESVKSYQIDVYHRNQRGRVVYDDLQSLENSLNCTNCVTLEGFEVLDVSALTFPVDQDIDDEDRRVGLLQATIVTYRGCDD